MWTRDEVKVCALVLFRLKQVVIILFSILKARLKYFLEFSWTVAPVSWQLPAEPLILLRCEWLCPEAVRGCPAGCEPWPWPWWQGQQHAVTCRTATASSLDCNRASLSFWVNGQKCGMSLRNVLTSSLHPCYEIHRVPPSTRAALGLQPAPKEKETQAQARGWGEARGCSRSNCAWISSAVMARLVWQLKAGCRENLSAEFTGCNCGENGFPGLPEILKSVPFSLKLNTKLTSSWKTAYVHPCIYRSLPNVTSDWNSDSQMTVIFHIK